MRLKRSCGSELEEKLWQVHLKRSCGSELKEVFGSALEEVFGSALEEDLRQRA